MKKQYTAMVIDDEQGSVEALRWVLKDDYNLCMFSSPKKGIAHLEENPDKIDLLFLDIMMDEMNGFDVLDEVKKISNTTEVIIVTSYRGKDIVISSMKKGAFDFVEKPYSVCEIRDVAKKALQKRVQYVCRAKLMKIIGKALSADNGLIERLVKEIYSNEKNISNHSRKVSDVYVQLAAKYFRITNEKKLRKIRMMAFLHDIGKLGISQEILMKRGALTELEYEEVKLHPLIGYNIVKHIDHLEDEVDVVLHHQERHDGKGYPHGLKGNEISEFSKIISIVDAFDAMTDTRPYRKGMDEESAIKELRRHSGTQFDPRFVDFFIDNLYNSELKMKKLSYKFSIIMLLNAWFVQQH